MKTLFIAILSLVTPFPACAQYLAAVVAGGGGLSATSNDVPAASVPLAAVLGAAVDSTGNVYGTNLVQGDDLLLKISSGGVLTIA